MFWWGFAAGVAVSVILVAIVIAYVIKLEGDTSQT